MPKDLKHLPARASLILLALGFSLLARLSLLDTEIDYFSRKVDRRGS